MVLHYAPGRDLHGSVKIETLALVATGRAVVLGEHLFQLSGPLFRLFHQTVGVVRNLVLLNQP